MKLKSTFMSIMVSIVVALAMVREVSAAQMQDVPLNQEMHTNALTTIENSFCSPEDDMLVICPNVSQHTIARAQEQKNEGIAIDILDDGKVNIVFHEDDLLGDPLKRIFLNEKTLHDIISQTLDDTFEQSSPEAITNAALRINPNPLWGKKLAVIGDSLTTAYPYSDLNKSYPAFVANRNSMTLVHKGVAGKMLCIDVAESNPSLISCYTNDVPSDADFILCQIGANDTKSNGWWTRDATANPPVPDDDMTTSTFKGCWNNLLIGLKKNYPNAKIGMILAHNWMENIGKKTEDAIVDTEKRRMTQWQKIQCQKLNIPVFDPQEDTRNFFFHRTSYSSPSQVDVRELDLDWYDRTKVEMGTATTLWSGTSCGFQTQYFWDHHHFTPKGALLFSFYIEKWMKTVLISQ